MEEVKKEIQILFIPKAAEDYKHLNGSQKKSVNKEIEKLKTNPFADGALGNKDNIDLTGFYKMYACNKSVRIVYRLITPEKVEIVESLGIGKRDKLKIYKTVVGDRLNNLK